MVKGGRRGRGGGGAEAEAQKRTWGWENGTPDTVVRFRLAQRRSDSRGVTSTPSPRFRLTLGVFKVIIVAKYGGSECGGHAAGMVFHSRTVPDVVSSICHVSVAR